MLGTAVFTVTCITLKQPVGIVYVIFEVPTDTPFTNPLVGLTVALAGLLLVQVPPDIEAFSCVTLPAHTKFIPLITGLGLIVTTAVSTQPVAAICTDIIAVPAVKPETIPVLTVTAALTGEAELQIPPDKLLANVRVLPSHTTYDPVVEVITGNAKTLMNFVTLAEQPNPFVTVYVMVVLPTLTPVTTPAPDTVAIDELLLVHTPPEVVLEKVTDASRHTPEGPVITATTGKGFTVTVVVTIVVQLNALDTL